MDLGHFQQWTAQFLTDLPLSSLGENEEFRANDILRSQSSCQERDHLIEYA